MDSPEHSDVLPVLYLSRSCPYILSPCPRLVYLVIELTSPSHDSEAGVRQHVYEPKVPQSLAWLLLSLSYEAMMLSNGHQENWSPRAEHGLLMVTPKKREAEPKGAPGLTRLKPLLNLLWY